ncbi:MULTISPECIES: universal stress protein [Streptomyces]|uniref:universal stress protein n=1 Tax=Streptomyces TaxID=1883 RepID=UPI000A3B92F5|nr:MULTISPECIES: universal stress protein [Streptomyces]MDX3633434.1 universal stress protein [Streptomyces europaeiscabiei]MDX3650660.1 universal stress protein [Streptomyces europaeiscabiei]WRZ54967.1 universal stress protein [Streptomyces sp. NBC_01314]
MEPAITVGLDGSPESLAAAHWAAAEAERRKLTLRLLHAWPLLVPEPTDIPSELDQNYWAKRIVHNARAELQAHHPGLSIVGNLVADDAQDALLQAASESEVLVLGSRGLTPVESYFMGDVSMPVVAKAEHPVVLVRAEAREGRPQPTAPTTGVVVVALKLHGPCDELLEFGFVTAAARGVPLRAIHGRSVPIHAHVPWGVDHDVTEEITQDIQKHLSQALRRWREKFPGVRVLDVVRLESPAKAVVSEAENAGLLVVGRRKHHPPVAPHLGHVAQAAVHHARCPVAVVPHG